MFNELPTKKRGGPSVFEVFVVLVVISVISVAAYVLLSGGQSSSRNVARAAQIKEYQKAFEYYYSDNGRYPAIFGQESASMCLGDYSDDRCWQRGESVGEQQSLFDALVPKYINKLPESETVIFGQNSETTYEGMVYRYQDFGSSYSILYFMDGNDEDCRLPGTENQNVGNDTLCTVHVTP